MGNSQNLKKILRDRKILQKQLALAIQVPESTISSWFKKDTSIPSECLISICTFLNISPYLLLTGREYNADNDKDIFLSDEEKEIINKYRYLSNPSKSNILSNLKNLYDMEISSEISSTMLPIKHSNFKVSAGAGEWLGDYDEWEEIRVPDTPLTRKADFALTVKGDSMTPDYENGNIILIKSQQSVDVGQIGIFIVDGKGYIKKYGGDRLISLNEKYEDILLEEYQNPQCKGLVIGKI